MVNKKQSKKINIIPFVVVGGISLVAIIWGCVLLSKIDLELENKKLECEQKDYSALVKVNRTETPGNENINNQIDIVKRAMDAAQQDGDITSWGELWEQYNDLLKMQENTSTVNETYDYSEVDKAKSKCRSMAENQRQIDFQKCLWLIIGGLIIGGADLAVYFILESKQKQTRKH